MNTLILGVGNLLLSDEAVGVRIVEGLERDYRFAPGIELLDGGTAGMELLEAMASRDHIILADAVRSCQALQLDFDTVLRNTCTSYLPDERGRSHGLTGSDVERILAFDQLGLRDPLDYAQPWEEIVAQAKSVAAAFRRQQDAH